jgi:pyrroline-5-carboxylate reductase
MGEALLGGLIAQSWCKASEIEVIELRADARSTLEATYGVRTAAAISASSGSAFLVAVKPQYVQSVCEAIGHQATQVRRSGLPVGESASDGTRSEAEKGPADMIRVLSVAAGVTIANLEKSLGGSPAVIRSMPNTPALVGLGASAIAGGTHASDADVEWARSILASVGVVETVLEWQLDAVTGVSGSGPAYIFLIAEAMIEAGVLQGLPRSVAVTLASQTIRGAGEMLVRNPDQAATLRANVTSPGGTTAAGLRALEDRAVRAAFIDAVSAATKRAQELGAAK